MATLSLLPIASDLKVPDIDFRQAQFLISAPKLKECPPEEGVEVAFAGRSNAGKSSAINALTENSKLARTSKTPGRTQLINYFSLGNPLQKLVDLPGYGYAKVPQELKNEWQKNLSIYLQERQCLAGLVLLMDIRHPLQEYDTMMLNWAVEVEMPIRILLTKADKLKRGAARNTLLKVERHLSQSQVTDLVSCQLFSSFNREGVPELKSVLNSLLSLDESAASETGDER